MKPQLESASISGTAQVGEILTASVEPAGATASYQWQSATDSDGSYIDIADATNSTYTLTQTESGKIIRVKATGTGDYTGEVYSAPTAAVSPAAARAAAGRKRG